jgi:hypothetical protein
MLLINIHLKEISFKMEALTKHKYPNNRGPIYREVTH